MMSSPDDVITRDDVITARDDVIKPDVIKHSAGPEPQWEQGSYLTTGKVLNRVDRSGNVVNGPRNGLDSLGGFDL